MSESRLPPQSLDAESSVISAILIDPDAIVKVADILVPESFYDKNHQAIYEAMMALYTKNQPIDVVTLTEYLRKHKKLSAIGGAAKLAELSSVVSTAANVVHYANLVADAFTKRKLISLSSEISAQAFDDSKEAKDVLDLAEQRVFAVSQVHSASAFLPIKETLVDIS